MRMSVEQQEPGYENSHCHYCGIELTTPDSTCVVAVFPLTADSSPYTVKVCEPCSDHHWELQMQAEAGKTSG